MLKTERVAGFVAQTRFEALPAEVVAAARRAILDTLGVTIAGAAEEGSRILLDWIAPPGAMKGIAPLGAMEGVSIFGTSRRAAAPQAALAGGMLGHALDFDDVSANLSGHPSVPVLPAVLAVAEASQQSGREALTAFAVGLEVECKLGRALGSGSYTRGWHATSVVGAIGAAAACANLMELDVLPVRHALGIAASMAGGTRQNFGTMTKPLHAGLAARAGVEAAELAARGFTADPNILEAPLGFGVLFSPDGDWHPERFGELGKPWDLVTPGISVKKYPCCYMTHRALDAALSATGARPHAATEIDRIEVHVPAGSVSALIHHRPNTGLEGKFSMEYCLAAALLDGAVRLGSFQDDAVQRPEAQALLRRVEIAEVPTAELSLFAPARVTVKLRDGHSLVAEVRHERGDPSDPLSWDELADKYRDCAGRSLPSQQIERSLALIESFEETPISELAEILVSGEVW